MNGIKQKQIYGDFVEIEHTQQEQNVYLREQEELNFNQNEQDKLQQNHLLQHNQPQKQLKLNKEQQKLNDENLIHPQGSHNQQ